MKKANSNFDNLTLSNDFLFKKVMQQKHICKHILEEILHTKIADITYLQAEETVDVYPDSHGIRLDVKVADTNDIHYNLEMQVKNPINKETGNFLLPKRTRYYQAMLDVDMLQKGQDYDELSPTYIIFICLFDFFEDDQYIYTFKKYCLENPSIELRDEATIMFLNTFGKKGNVSSDIKSLFEYINKNLVTSNFTQEVANTIVDIKNDKKVRKEYMTYEMRMKDLRNEAFYEGKIEGKAEGRAEEQITIAKNLLQMHLPTQDIAKATKLSIDEIKKLKAEILQPI